MLAPPQVTLVSLYPTAGRHAGRSGVASYTVNLAHALAGAGAGVSVVAQVEPGLPRHYVDGPVRVLRGFARGTSALPGAARAALETGAAVVHIQLETFLYGGPAALAGLVPALWILRRAGRRVVITLHQVVDPRAVDLAFVRLHRVRAPASLARAGIASLQRMVGRAADAVVVHEPAFAGIVPDATVIPHGVETLVSPPSDGARSDLGLNGAPVVLCFGFVAPYKGLESALEAARLTDAFQLVVAGGEHPRLASRDPYGTQLRSRWTGTARFTGYVPEDDIPRWFAAADVALYPYPDPFSSSGSLALALGYGRPVLLSPQLASCVGAERDLIVPLEPPALARALRETLTDAMRLGRIRRGTRALAVGRSWPEVARSHLDLYEEVLSADRAARRSLRAG